MKFDEFLTIIPKIKNIKLPAETSQFKMVPAFRQAELQKRSKDKSKAREAGVLALFYPNVKNDTQLVLILRKTYPGVHSGQIGFPGGKLEDNDNSIQAAALRETFEEVGVPVHDIHIIRQLTPVYIPPSHFNVTPFLGLCRHTPSFKKQETEVEAILEISFDEFLNDNNVVTEVLSTSYSAKTAVPAFKLDRYIVWGATAMMLSEIKDLFKTVYLV